MGHLLENENNGYIVQVYYKKEEMERKMYTIMTGEGFAQQKKQVHLNLPFVHLQGLEPWTP